MHIHPGRESCGQCEAAEVKAAMETVALTNQQSLDEAQLLADPSVSKESVRRANINALKLKYGLKKVRRVFSFKKYFVFFRVIFSGCEKNP